MATAEINQSDYRGRIWAWTMYDWANSAFATTILAAVLPFYFSQVAGATLPSATVATTYWSAGLSFSLLIIAILSPILGTISDIMRGKKRFLSLFVGIGVLATASLVFVSTGDWILAAIFGIIGRIGFSGANVFYDALLPHVAKPEDQDMVSTRGYAMGYLGGGLLLAMNVVMIQFLPGTWGARLSFLSVAIWWAVFSIPLFLRIPEPPAATIKLARGENVIGVSFKRLWGTFRDIRRYRELFKFLLAFLIYNDGIGTIIGVAVIYGAELGFGSTELVLAILLVQFVGIPYSLIFGRLPSKNEKRRPVYLAFILFNIIALPLVGILGARMLPGDIVGAPPEPYVSTDSKAGQGLYDANSDAVIFAGIWEMSTIPASIFEGDNDVKHQTTMETGAGFEFPYVGQQVELVYSLGPDHGIWSVSIDGKPLMNEDEGVQVTIDAYNPTIRYDESQVFTTEEPGEHILSVANTTQRNESSIGNLMTFTRIEVLPGIRQSNLGVIILMIVVVELIGLVFALLFGKLLFSGLAETLDTKRSILIALTVYAVIACWGFVLDSVVEFWFLAWMVAVVQGGSQALSRSLYSAMSPASKSGEFFGLFGVMEKFSTILGPLVFVAAGLFFGSSRPAVLSLIVFFIIGGLLLTRVNVDEGINVARREDEVILDGKTPA